MDFFADRMFLQCYREVIEDMTTKGYWKADRKVKELALWKSLTKGILKNFPAHEVYTVLEDCIYEVSDEQHNKEKLFQKAQTSYKISEARKKNPGAKGKARKLIDAKLKITDVAKKYGLEVKKNKCLCPFHADGHPSMSFSDDKNVFNCFGCGAKGDVIEFIRRLEDAKK